MLDMGFQDDISYIQDSITSPSYKSMIFSATLPPFILKLAAKNMAQPVMLDLVGKDTNQLPE
jgi:superfamily II DNA/RNA helicase